MSELEARKYMSIHNLREEIRQDMEDYKLIVSWSPKEALKSFIFSFFLYDLRGGF